MNSLSLTQLTVAIGNAVRRDPVLQSVWVTAELSDLRGSGGHCYMELIEKDQRGQTVAKLRANIWQNYFIGIRRKFYEATGRDITGGIKVMLFGAVTHHPLYGLSFSVTDIDPSYTLGDLERLRREIIERLTREGVAGVNRSLTFPMAPRRVAVISAPGAAGFGDFMNQLCSSPEGFVFYPFLVPAVMQGDRTAPSVMEALDFIESTIDLWDCVAIVRGGGATTDMNGFDNYDLARRVATFPLPVVVGIGHERDRNVLDELACVRAKTPTAVAAFLIDCMRRAYASADTLARNIAAYVTQRLAGERTRLSNAERMVPAVATHRLRQARMALDSAAARIPMAAAAGTARANLRLDHLAETIKFASMRRLANESEALGQLIRMVGDNATRPMARSGEKLLALESLVKALDPASALRRGYSLTYADGHVLRNACDVSPGTIITTRLASGEIISEIKSKK